MDPPTSTSSLAADLTPELSVQSHPALLTRILSLLHLDPPGAPEVLVRGRVPRSSAREPCSGRRGISDPERRSRSRDRLESRDLLGAGCLSALSGWRTSGIFSSGRSSAPGLRHVHWLSVFNSSSRHSSRSVRICQAKNSPTFGIVTLGWIYPRRQQQPLQSD